MCAALLPGLAHLIATREVTAKCLVDWAHAGVGRTSTRISALRSMICTIGVIQCSTVPSRTSNSYDACCSQFMSVSSATTRTVCIDDLATRSHGSFVEWDACDEHPYNEQEHFHPVGSGSGIDALRVSVAPQTTDGFAAAPKTSPWCQWTKSLPR